MRDGPARCGSMAAERGPGHLRGVRWPFFGAGQGLLAPFRCCRYAEPRRAPIRTPRSRVSRSAPRLDPVGATTPVGPPEYGLSDSPVQRPGGRGSHVCLLKGCERPFQPSHPLHRYCSKSCQEAARDWQRWRAARRYRSTAQGQEQRREQSRRYRERQRLRRAAGAAERAAKEEAADGREGQRYPDFSEDFCGQPCGRPGCYELFQPQPRSPLQCFCCASCRRALRRVRQREARWRNRRRLIVAGRFRPPPRC